MTKPTTIETLLPAIGVLGDTVTDTSDNFQQLLNQLPAYSFCREAGRTLRCLSEHYSKVLLAALAYTPDPYAEDEDFEEDEGELLSEEEIELDE